MTRLEKMKKFLPVLFVFLALVYISNIDLNIDADNDCNALSQG